MLQIGTGSQKRNPCAHASEESDTSTVSTKRRTKAVETAPAEVAERRLVTKENIVEPHTQPTQSGARVSQGLHGVRERARKNPREKFTALLHHITTERLWQSYYALKRKALPGVDGVTWNEYETGLQGRLADLHSRIHRGAYRAQPSKRTWIPKADGTQRPLGIAALEDKVVQHAVVTVLNQIYEADFKGFSYGFRPGRHQHMALDALSVGMQRKKVNWVLDIDIRKFFDKLSQEWLVKFIGHRVADRRILRLIQKWLKAGVIDGGEWLETDEGTPQGAVISPLLANVYLHYVFDQWADQWRKSARGDIIIVRYADDAIIGFQYLDDARRLLEQLKDRLAKFSLELNETKTKLIEFGRYARKRRRQRGQGKPESFTFLGFKHVCANVGEGGFFVLRITDGKRRQRKLQEIKQQLWRRMHAPVASTGEWLRGVLLGYYQYHAVPGNLRALGRFRHSVKRMWRHVLRRRGDKRKPNWAKLVPIFDLWLPTPEVVHPLPSERFDARIQGRSRVL